MTKGNWIVLLVIVVIAAVPRLYNNGWDSYHSLHPDERFIAMVSNDTQLPSSFSEYLDPNRSPLNPYSVPNATGGKKYPLFVYGTFPLTVVKLVAKVVGQDHYAGYMKVGRVLSALADLLTLSCWFIVVAVLSRIYSWPKIVPCIFGFMYSFAVLPIQLSHFYTVDTFQSAACAFALMAAVYARVTATVFWCILVGLGFGIAVACKISALFSAPIVLWLALFPAALPTTKAAIVQLLKDIAWRGLVIALVTVVTTRVCDPHLFESSSLLNLSISQQFIANIRELSAASSWQEWPWPPGVQWLARTPMLSPFSDVFWYGIGPVVSFLVLCGIFSRRLRASQMALLICGWTLLYFVYHGSRFVHTMRYFLPIYPVFAVLAAHGFLVLSNRKAFLRGHLLSWSMLAILVLLWPSAFISIYTKPHSRVEASHWILKNIPPGSVIAVEHWDDGLPLQVDPSGPRFVAREIGIFGEDTPQKWAAIQKALEGVNYIILSSNRGYGSMGRLPMKYPITFAWYESLFKGTKEWEMIYDLHRKPDVHVGPIRLEWDTQNADEAFSVYDHPRVTVFRRKKGC